MGGGADYAVGQGELVGEGWEGGKGGRWEYIRPCSEAIASYADLEEEVVDCEGGGPCGGCGSEV